MSRGKLDGADWEKICQEIPDLSNLGDMVLHLSPDVISINLPHESDIQEVPAIFHDIFHTLGSAVYALGEVFAHQRWYLKKKELTCPPKTSPGKMLDLDLIRKGAYLWVEGRILRSRSSTS